MGDGLIGATEYLLAMAHAPKKPKHLSVDEWQIED
jgi:hypothetical protein